MESGFGRTDTIPPDIHALSSVVRINGPFAAAIRAAIGDAWIAPSYARAAEASALTPWPVATMEGDLFRGPHLVSGGDRAEARGILETKREIKVAARSHRVRARRAGCASPRTPRKSKPSSRTRRARSPR